MFSMLLIKNLKKFRPTTMNRRQKERERGRARQRRAQLATTENVSNTTISVVKQIAQNQVELLLTSSFIVLKKIM